MLRRALVPLLALAALTSLPAAALAGATATTPARSPARPSHRISLHVVGSWTVGRKPVGVAGHALRVVGRIAPYEAGQSIELRIWRGHTLIERTTVHPRPTATQRTATFSVRFVPARSGFTQIFAVYKGTADTVVADAELSILAPAAGPGSRGPFVALLQQRLAAVGYATPRTGVYDPLTGLAVLAFRKVNGMARVTTLSPLVVDRLLRGVGGFRIRYPRQGHHVEANLGWQVLALIDKGRVVRAYTTSSGKPSTPTVLGTFRFYMREPGTNSHGMVDSTYFIRGYAIHGYFDVPAYAASHGCLRVPIPDAFAIYSWIHLGDQIDVYY
ncbi:MAG TPA: L,D-transpeptidase family protein [Conexibacter sp.]|nr:L,D-transpeptidase family protein [Conexibacter sp.]